ncbi:neural proliferation differentiation and control protein 1a [Latimeria chalumnae]|nr:PREDICTED: neural proliferation differentiation and control protein 1 [Latimeria chalumnae]|eukprot:XP_014342927.1 PREDICTED: neural proliferation differentiation and control protein 1 [Latimeria chalumnae]
MVAGRKASLCRLRAPLLSGVVLSALLLLHASASKPDVCDNLDCTIKRRKFCDQKLNSCGPCMEPFVEDKNGVCVPRGTFQDENMAVDNPDEEIDHLASIINFKDSHNLQVEPEANLFPKVANFAESAKKLQVGGQSGTENPLKTTGTTMNTPSRKAVKTGPEVTPYLMNDALLLTVIIVCAVTGVSALIVAGVCWYRLQKDSRLAQKTDYSVFRNPNPIALDKSSPGDKKLAQSAQMYHYQHQKQQMLSMEKHKEEPKVPDSATTSDEENEDGDFTVYECPGLAPTGEMEVKNPLFDDSSLHHPPSPKTQ